MKLFDEYIMKYLKNSINVALRFSRKVSLAGGEKIKYSIECRFADLS